MIQRTSQEKVFAGYKNLSKLQEMLWLRDFKKKSYNTLAIMFNCHVETVKTYCARHDTRQTLKRDPTLDMTTGAELIKEEKEEKSFEKINLGKSYAQYLEDGR